MVLEMELIGCFGRGICLFYIRNLVVCTLCIRNYSFPCFGVKLVFCLGDGMCLPALIMKVGVSQSTL